MIVQFVPDGAEPGRVSHVVKVHAPNYPEMLQQAGLAFIHLEDPPAFDPLSAGYVVDGVMLQRDAFPGQLSKSAIAADDIDEAVISDLPDPCNVMIDGEPIEVTGGELRLTSAMPATYRIEIQHWPFLPWSATVVAE